MNTTVTALMEVKEKLSFWKKWVSKAKTTKVYGKYKGYSVQFYKYAKQNPHFQKFEELQENIAYKIDELKEVYETTQNPLIWKIRDVGDRVSLLLREKRIEIFSE